MISTNLCKLLSILIAFLLCYCKRLYQGLFLSRLALAFLSLWRVKNVPCLDILQGREILDFVGDCSCGEEVKLVEEKGLLICVGGFLICVEKSGGFVEGS